MLARRQRWWRYAPCRNTTYTTTRTAPVIGPSRARTLDVRLSHASLTRSQAIMRVDGLLEEHFIAPAVKHADGLASTALRLNLGRLDPLFARMWGHDATQQDRDTMERTDGGAGQAISGAL